MNDYRFEVQRADRPVHQSVPYVPATQMRAPVMHATGQDLAQVQTVQLPDGRIVSGYAVGVAQAEPQQPQQQGASPLAKNLALGGVAFAGVCGGLALLTGFIAALAALVQQLMILAAVIFGGWVAVMILGGGKGKGGNTVNAKKAVFKGNTFQG